MGAHDKINAISLNVKINKQKSVHICGYKLPINVQNFMQKDSAQVKILSKVVGGLLATFFDSSCSVPIPSKQLRPQQRSHYNPYK